MMVSKVIDHGSPNVLQSDSDLVKIGSLSSRMEVVHDFEVSSRNDNLGMRSSVVEVAEKTMWF
jgi:hypothetical protein